MYEVEGILARRGSGSRVQYLVQWKGYPLYEATWEPRASLMDGARQVVEAYEAEIHQE